ncbi:MAG TPA: glucokinase [Methylomirabilota bacterium]|nr:glucokinase [Methylomirabilota bacterium]
MILAGDIGGTNTRLALFALRDGVLRPAASQVYPSGSHRGLGEIVVTFLAAHGRGVAHACFGIAGPVRDGISQATNLPWVVDSRSLARDLEIAQVWLINDLEANAFGLGALGPRDFETLNPGAAAASGNMAVISAGTGLGEAGLYWDGRQHHPFASEGGHADWAPADEVQMELLRFLMKELGHVSVERVLSGPGLQNIYRFLRDTGRGEEPAWLQREIEHEGPAAAISAAAQAGRSPLCVQALDLFVAIYGAEAGNLALKVMATGGVYVGGGIAPKIVGWMRSRGFMEAFTAKGRLRTLVEDMPVRVILNDHAALLGAARCAALRAGLIHAG